MLALILLALRGDALKWLGLESGVLGGFAILRRGVLCGLPGGFLLGTDGAGDCAGPADALIPLVIWSLGALYLWGGSTEFGELIHDECLDGDAGIPYSPPWWHWQFIRVPRQQAPRVQRGDFFIGICDFVGFGG